MNHIYRLVWCDRTAAFVAVSEITKRRGKRSSGTVGGVSAGGGVLAGAALVGSLLLAPPAFANPLANTLPSGAQVTVGAASVSTAANTLTVNQASDRTAINWTSFSIGDAATVNFVQPSSSAIALNRVIGNEQSVIAGALNANGQVFLLNSNGLLFTEGASINTAGLVASTLSLSDADFSAGNMQFSDGSTAGAVINMGSITISDGGYAALVGHQVSNGGSIVARMGTVALAAGDRVSLNFNGSSLVNVTVDQAALNALVENKQAIYADGGQVILSARAVDAILANVVNNEGFVQARSIANINGVIRLEGGDTGVVSVSGTLDASGAGVGETGGAIVVTGHNVGLFDGAHIDASGAAGGGDVLIGGDVHGQGTAANAFRTFVADGASINADALAQGDGGKVVVWADDVTRFAGSISARGGVAGGDGGFAEVSGKEGLVFRGTVDLRADAGATGELLFDPRNITVAAAGPDAIATNDAFAEAAATDVTFSTANLVTALNGANVTLQANNDITFDAAVTATAGTSSLTLEAGRSIAINDDITLRGAFTATANIASTAVVEANRTTASDGTFTMADGKTIATTGAAAAGANISVNVQTGDPDITVAADKASGDITLANLDAGTAGQVTINQQGATAGSDILRTATSLLTGATVNLTSTHAIGASGNALQVNATTLNATSGGNIGDDIFVTDTLAGVQVGTINAGAGDVALTSLAGSITDAADDGNADIIAASLTLSAAGAGADLGAAGNALEIDAAMLSATTAGSAGDDIVVIDTNGGIEVVDVDAGAGDVALTALLGSIIDSATDDGVANLVGGTVTLATTDSSSTIGAALDDVLEIDATTLVVTTNDNHVYLEDTAGGVALGAINTGVGTAVLGAAGGSMTDGNGAATNITAGAAILSTSRSLDGLTFGGNIGTTGDALETTIGTLTATTDSGAIGIANSAALIIDSVIAKEQGFAAVTTVSGLVRVNRQNPDNSITVLTGTKDVSVSAVGDVVLNTLNAANAATITATGGAILDANGATNNLVARTATLNTGGAVGMSADPIESTVETVNATTVDGGVFVAQTTSLQVGTIAAGGAASDVTVTTTGSTLRLGSITAAGAVSVQSNNGTLVDANGAAVNISAASAQLVGTSGIGTAADQIDTAVDTLTASTTTIGAKIYVNDADALASVNVKTTDGDVIIKTGASTALTFVASTDALSSAGTALTFENAGGGLVLGSLNAGANAVTLIATGAISDGNGAAANITATTATLTASTSIGALADAIDTAVDTLTATAGSGGVFIAETDGIALGTVRATGIGNDVVISNLAGDMTVGSVTAPDQITLTAAGSLVDGNVAGLNLSATGATLSAGGAIAASGDVLETAVTTLANATALGGGLFIANSSALTLTGATATGGDLSVRAAGGIALGTVTATGQAITLAAAGAITDANGATNNIAGSSATLSGTAIGALADKIETSVATLSATSTAGGTFISDAGTGSMTTTLSAGGSGANIDIDSAGSLILNSVSALGDNVKIVVAGSIDDGNGSATNITAKALDITAPGGMGTALDGLENIVTELSVSGGSAPGTGIFLTNAAPLSITGSSLEGRGAGTTVIDAEEIYILDMASDQATMDANGSLTLRATKGNIVFFDLDDTISLSGTGSFTATANAAGAVAIIGNIETAGGAIAIAANSNITIGELNAAAGNVSVQSATGQIVDGNGAALNVIAGTLTMAGNLVSARDAELNTITKIADAAGARAEANAKESVVDVFTAGATVMAAAEVAATAAVAVSTADVAVKQAAADAADDVVLGLTISHDIADGVALALSIAADVAEAVAAPAQAVPLTGDGGTMTVATVLKISAHVAEVVAYGLGISLDIASGVAAERGSELTGAEAELVAATSTETLATATAQAFQEGLSIADAAFDAAVIASDAAAMVSAQAIAAEDAASVAGTSTQALGIQVTGRVDVAATGGGSVYLDATGTTQLGNVSAAGLGVVSVDGSSNLNVIGAVSSGTSVQLNAAGAILDGGGVITAPTLAAYAQTGIAGDLVVRNLTAATTAGAITLTNAPAGAVTINELSTGSASNISYSQTGQNLTVAGNISSQGGNILVDPPVDVAIDSDMSTTGTGTITIQASGVVSVGDGATVSTDSGALTIEGAGSGAQATRVAMVDNSALTSTSGTVTVRAGTITLDDVTTGGNVVLVSTGAGAVTTQTTGTAGKISASNLAITQDVAGLINVMTKVTSLDVVGGNASTTVEDDDDLVVNSIASTAVVLVAGGAVTDGNGAATNIAGSSLDVSAADGIDLDTAVASVTASVTGTGAINLNELNAITLTDLSTVDGSITVTAGGDIAVDTVSALANTVLLDAGGAITDANVAANNVTASILDATAVTGIDLDTTIGTLTASVTGVGNINIDEVDNLAVNTLSAAGDTVTLNAGGAITDANGAANNVTASILDATAVTGIDLDTTIGTLTASVTGVGNITIDEVDNLAVNTLSAAGDTVTLNAGGAITDANGAANNVTASVLDATAVTGIDLDTTIGTLTASVTGVGNITIDEADNLAVNTLSAAGDTVTLNAGGAITDANGATNNVTASILDATAVTGIDLDTTIGTITASVTGVGNITIDEVDNLAVNTLSAAGDTVTLNAGGAITDANGATNNVTASILDATAVTGIDLDTTIGTITASVTGVGNITIDEVDNLAVNTLSAAGDTVTLNAGGAITDGNGATNNVTASILDATAVTGIDLDTTLSSVTASVTGTGAINLDELNDITLTSLMTDDGNITVTAGGDIAVDTVSAVDSVITLDAGDEITDANGVAMNLTASGLDLAAVNGIGIGNALETSVDTVTAYTETGDIVLDEANSVTLVDVTNDDGDITVTASGNIAVDTVSALANTVLLDAGGAITDANGATNNVTASILDATAVTGIDLDTTIGTITASVTGVGNINIDEVDNLAVNTLSAAGDTVTLNAGGAITDGNGATNNVTASILDATAVTGIDLDTTLSSVTASVTGTGAINLDELNDITLTSLMTDDGDITVTAVGDIAVDTVSAVGSLVTLDAGDEITDANGVAMNLTASGLDLAAVNGIGIGNALETSVDTIAAYTETGDIVLDEAGSVTLVDVTNDDGDITVTAGGDIAVDTVSAVGSLITLDAGDEITDANGAAMNLTATALDLTAVNGIGVGDALETNIVNLTAYTATGTIAINETDDLTLVTLTNDAGDIDITSGGSIAVDNVAAFGGTVVFDAMTTITDSNGGATNVTADMLDATAGGSITLDINVDSLSAAVTGTGDIDISERDDIALVTLSTADGDIDVVAGGSIVVGGLVALDHIITLDSGAAITDANGDDMNLTADSLDLHAVTGIGVGDALEINVRVLAADTTGGALALVNESTEHTVTVNKLTTGDASDISVEAPNADILWIAGPVNSAGGDILLASGSDMLVNADIDTIGSGNITLRSSDTLILADQVAVSTDSGTVIVEGGEAGLEAVNVVMSEDSSLLSVSGDIIVRAATMSLDNVTAGDTVTLDSLGIGDISTQTVGTPGQITARNLVVHQDIGSRTLLATVIDHDADYSDNGENGDGLGLSSQTRVSSLDNLVSWIEDEAVEQLNEQSGRGQAQAGHALAIVVAGSGVRLPDGVSPDNSGAAAQ